MTEAQRNWLRRAGWTAFALVLVAGVGLMVSQLLRESGVPQERPITTVMRVVLPPPPPPPPKPPPPEQQPLLQQPKLTPLETPTPQQPKPQPPKANNVPRPPGNPLTAEAGPGANPYGLQAGNGGGDVIGGGGGNGGGGGSRFGYYAGLIASQIESVLQSDEQTRYFHFRGVVVRMWLSPSGKVTRAEIVNSTGEPTRDSTLTRVLGGVAVREAPPQDMPQPVVVRIGTQG
jgi:protein TonB